MERTFCAIVAGDLPASVVYDDDAARAFMDLHPATPAAAVRASTIAPEGINVFLADGEAAGQEVFHVYLRVLPRRAGDGVGVVADFASPTRGELDRTAATIRDALG
jgi:diadenosine tetraphosphate (Ap4A) HIT family hydrolase